MELVWLTLEGAAKQELVAKFEAANPGIRVRIEPVSFNDLFQQIQVRLGANGPTPDVIQVDVPMVAAYGNRGWLEPLDSAFSAADKADWIESSLQSGTYGGRLLAAPVMGSTQLLFYNRDMFAKAGITPPGQNERWTWEQIAEASKKLTVDENGDGTPEVWGFTWEATNQIYQLQPLPVSKGGASIGPDGLTVRGVIDSQPWIDAATFYWKMFNEWKVAPQTDTWPSDLFVTGKLAMFVGGPWNITRYATETKPSFGWDVSRHPYFEGGAIAVPTGSWHMGVNVHSQHKPEALRFVRWLSTGEGAQLWQKLGLADFPTHTSILQQIRTDPAYGQAPMSFMRVAADEATVHPVPRPQSVGYLEYQQILQDTFKDIQYGTEPRKALETAVERIEREMQKYR